MSTVFLPKLGKSVRLGRIIPKTKPKCLSLANYLPAQGAWAALPPPAAVDYYTKASPSISRMYLNDQYGDCVIASKMHKLGVWSANDTDAGGVIMATDNEVLSQYHEICGPGDNGCVIADVLNHFRDKGLVAGGRNYKIDGWVSVDNTNKLEVQYAIWLFGALTLGITLPASWLNSGDGDDWGPTWTPPVGGHDVCAVGYDDKGVWVATWGGKRRILWDAFTSSRYIDECYVHLAPSWYNADGIAPSGLDVATLKADLIKIGNGELPDVVPPVTPPTPPVPPVDPPVPPIDPPTPPTPPVPGPELFYGDGVGEITYRGPLGITHTTTATFTNLRFKLAPQDEHLFQLSWHPNWKVITDLALAIAPVIIADIQAGKTPFQISQDVILTALQVLQNGNSPEPAKAAAGSVNWQLILQLAVAIAPVVIADYQAKKSPTQIAEDVAAAVLIVLAQNH